jgi:hypothetical protein
MTLGSFIGCGEQEGNCPVKMIYCKTDQVEEVRALHRGRNSIRLNEHDSEKLRNLEEQPNLLLIVTEPHLMRGIDYRAHFGIEMLLCRPFEHERS